MSVTFTGPELHTERLTLRMLKMSDFDAWHRFYMSDRARFIRSVEPDLANSWRVFAHIIGMWVLRGYGSFVICERGSDAPLGSVGPWHPAEWPEQEIGWTVWRPDAEGRGLAHEAVLAARNYAFGQLGWKTAVSYIDPDNARSIALAERLGAVLDTSAETPGEHSCLVYRHNIPSELSNSGPEASK